MIGWRARLGIILPSVNIATEPEFYRCLPDGVSAHFARMEFKESTEEYYRRMIDDVPTGARMLSHAHVDSVMFACTTGSLYGGRGYDTAIIEQLRAHNPAPASTTSTAVLEAFRVSNVRRVSVVTPYPEFLDALERRFFEQNGIEVLNIDGMGMWGVDVGETHPHTLYRFVKQHVRRDADGLFISCMGLRTLEIVAVLERELGIPVMSSNQVTLWKALQLASIPLSDVPVDFGSLLSRELKGAEGG